jgi:hypothetical protein
MERVNLLRGSGRPEEIVKAIADIIMPQKQTARAPLDRRFEEDMEILLASARKHETCDHLTGTSKVSWQNAAP